LAEPSEAALLPKRSGSKRETRYEERRTKNGHNKFEISLREKSERGKSLVLVVAEQKNILLERSMAQTRKIKAKNTLSSKWFSEKKGRPQR